MTVAEIIRSLGGRQEVARLTGAAPAAISMWRQIGVPSKYWHVLVDHAATCGKTEITFSVLKATKPSRKAAPEPAHQVAA